MAALLHELRLEEAVIAALAANFNAELAASAGRYGVEPFALDFGEDSISFLREKFDPTNIEFCEAMEFPAGCVYTGEATDLGQPRGVRYNGAIMVHLDFYYRSHAGLDGALSSRVLKQIADAVHASFLAYEWPTSDGMTITYTRRIGSEPDYLIPLGDGVGQAMQIKAQFNVQVS
jgi:hypothetical protein